MSGKVKILNQENFQNTIASGISLVDFWAEWCGPCKMQKPIIEDLANKIGEDINICSVDTDQNQSLASEYNIMSIPTIILFKDGQMVQQMVGLQSLDQLEKVIHSAQT